jgi:hypothetical protein
MSPLQGQSQAKDMRDGANVATTRLRHEPVGNDSDRRGDRSRLIVSQGKAQRSGNG